MSTRRYLDSNGKEVMEEWVGTPGSQVKALTVSESGIWPCASM